MLRAPFIAAAIDGLGGAGTLENPFPIGDLVRGPAYPSSTISVACSALTLPGDILYLRGGVYVLNLRSDDLAYGYPAIRFPVSGAPGNPITIAAYPGEQVILIRDSGSQPIIGTFATDYCVIDNLEVRGTSELIRLTGVSLVPVIRSVGNVVRRCKVVAQHVDTGDNHDGLRADMQDQLLVELNEVSGVTGKPGTNAAAFKSYELTNSTVRNNNFHDCNISFYNKTKAIQFVDTAARNAYYGNLCANGAQLSDGGHEIYGNVFDESVWMLWGAQDIRLHHNLFRLPSGRSYVVSANAGNDATNVRDFWRFDFHSNVVVGRASTLNPVVTNFQPFGTPGDPECVLLGDDHNLYVRDDSTAAPTLAWQFARYSATPETKTLAAMQALGFAAGNQAIPGGTDALFSEFSGVAATLRADYLTADRDGSQPGPADVALILDTTRYGPVFGETEEPPEPGEPPPTPPTPLRRMIGILSGPALYMLPDTVLARRKGPKSTDPSGGRIDTYIPDETPLSCYVQDANPNNVPDLNMVATMVNTVAYFPANPGLQPGDLLDVLDASGNVVRVLSVVRTRTEGLPGYLWRVDCKGRD